MAKKKKQAQQQYTDRQQIFGADGSVTAADGQAHERFFLLCSRYSLGVAPVSCRNNLEK